MEEFAVGTGGGEGAIESSDHGGKKERRRLDGAQGFLQKVPKTGRQECVLAGKLFSQGSPNLSLWL